MGKSGVGRWRQIFSRLNPWRKRRSTYTVVYLGQLNKQQGKDTYISNLVLGLGLSDDKVTELIERPNTILKRFDNAADAHRLMERLERAGAASRLDVFRQ